MTDVLDRSGAPEPGAAACGRQQEHRLPADQTQDAAAGAPVEPGVQAIESDQQTFAQAPPRPQKQVGLVRMLG